VIRELAVHRVDNGYLIAYPTGEKRRFLGFFGEEQIDVTGVRYCATPAEVGQTITAMLTMAARRRREVPVQAALPTSLTGE
jgi:hypothetical protein